MGENSWSLEANKQLFGQLFCWHFLGWGFLQLGFLVSGLFCLFILRDFLCSIFNYISLCTPLHFLFLLSTVKSEVSVCTYLFFMNISHLIKARQRCAEDTRAHVSMALVDWCYLLPRHWTRCVEASDMVCVGDRLAAVISERRGKQINVSLLNTPPRPLSVDEGSAGSRLQPMLVIYFSKGEHFFFLRGVVSTNWGLLEIL